MKDALNYQHVDIILNMFFHRLPYGANYFTLTYTLNFEYEEWDMIFDFLVGENLIEPWGENDQYIISEKGQSVISDYDGIHHYLNSPEKIK